MMCTSVVGNGDYRFSDFGIGFVTKEKVLQKHLLENVLLNNGSPLMGLFTRMKWPTRRESPSCIEILKPSEKESS